MREVDEQEELNGVEAAVNEPALPKEKRKAILAALVNTDDIQELIKENSEEAVEAAISIIPPDSFSQEERDDFIKRFSARFSPVSQECLQQALSESFTDKELVAIAKISEVAPWLVGKMLSFSNVANELISKGLERTVINILGDKLPELRVGSCDEHCGCKEVEGGPTVIHHEVPAGDGQ